MIAFLQGRVQACTDQGLVILVGGVGFAVTTPQTTAAAIGDEVNLVIYEHIKEGCYDLYGFSTVGAKDLFELLIGVNGIGPRMALALMNLGEPEGLRHMIASNDIAGLTQANGVGRRLAERLVVDLQDRLGDVAKIDYRPGKPAGADDEAVIALVNWGLPPDEARQALSGVEPELETADRVRQALAIWRGR